MIEPAAIDLPEVVAEVTACFVAYEEALLSNDLDALDNWFWPDERLVRFGLAEIQHGATAVAVWRRAAGGVPADRLHRRVTVSAFGSDSAVVSLEFTNGEALPLGRQSQLWARLTDGWHIVHAHVSMLSAP